MDEVRNELVEDEPALKQVDVPDAFEDLADNRKEVRARSVLEVGQPREEEEYPREKGALEIKKGVARSRGRQPDIGGLRQRKRGRAERYQDAADLRKRRDSFLAQEPKEMRVEEEAKVGKRAGHMGRACFLVQY